MSTELTEVSQAVAEFDRVAAGLAELESKYKGVVYDVTTTKGMKEAVEARRAIRTPRLEVERIRKAAKAPILALGRKLDTEAARITKELEELECPISDQITTEEARKDRERQEKVEAEMRRVQRLQERVAELRGNRMLSTQSGSATIAQHLLDLEALPVDDSFEEFRQQAEDAKAAGLSWLRELHSAALAHEAEQERIRQEREELKRLREEQALREAQERARIAEEERRAKAEREAEIARQAEQARQRREQEERDRAARQEIVDAENERVRAEQEAERERLAEAARKLAAEQAEIERKAREQREAQEAEERRIASERAALERQQREAREAEERKAAEARAEAERQEQAARRRVALRKRVSTFTARDIAEFVADETGAELSMIAARIAEIPHEDWLELALTEQSEVAA